MNLRELEFILKYPAFTVIFVGLYLAYQRGWDLLASVGVYVGLGVLLLALMMKG